MFSIILSVSILYFLILPYPMHIFCLFFTLCILSILYYLNESYIVSFAFSLYHGSWYVNLFRYVEKIINAAAAKAREITSRITDRLSDVGRKVSDGMREPKD